MYAPYPRQLLPNLTQSCHRSGRRACTPGAPREALSARDPRRRDGRPASGSRRKKFGGSPLVGRTREAKMTVPPRSAPSPARLVHVLCRLHGLTSFFLHLSALLQQTPPSCRTKIMHIQVVRRHSYTT